MNISFLNMSKTEFTKKTIMIILGSLINAAAVNLFIIPSKLLNGGLSGISLIIHYLFNIPVGLLLLILNIPLFILSILKTDKKFTLFTGIGTLALSLGLMITSPLSKILSPAPDVNRLLYCIYGGVIGGLGLGIVFSNQGSTGGIDIISVIAKRKYNMDIGMASFALNFIIVAVGSVFFGIQVGLYTLIVMYASSHFMDMVLKGFSRQKMLIIVTKKEDEVSKAIMNKLNRGITILYGEGAYTKEQINIIYCVVSPGQLPRLKQLIREIDPNSFISITDTSEVQGKGFINPA
ncbi:MAG: YitT family protein [Clostridium sp.]|nr:YitT family protein [Clostridium sp.]